MQNILNIYKNLGETPLEAVKRFKNQFPEYCCVPMTYAGRLDPMAEGVLLVLAGEEVKRKEKYLELDKEYEFEMLFGFSTDTYDILGKVVEVSDKGADLNDVKRSLEEFKGVMEQTYPPFSSKPVDGKPLFMWAREGALGKIEIPSRDVEVYSINLLNFENIPKDDLKNTIKERVNLVKGDFRQEEIMDIWDMSIKNINTKTFLSVSVSIYCSSGTYVRSIVHELGKRLGIPAVTLSIKRTRIGEYKIEKSRS